MRTPLNNPFSPGSDIVPEVWGGRTEQLTDWTQRVRPRRLTGMAESARTILGEPGLGKSTLVRRIARDAVAAGDWVTPQLRIPERTDPFKPVAAALLDLARQAGLAASQEHRLTGLISRVSGISVHGWGVELAKGAGPDPHTTLTELLVEIGLAGIRQNKVALIHLDEMQNVTDEAALSQLLIALGDAITRLVPVEVPGGTLERTLPLAVYLTGLPDFEDKAGANRGATFARRFDVQVLGPLSDADLTQALQPFLFHGWETTDADGSPLRVHMAPDALQTIVRLCHGDPFLFQLAGQQAWDAGTGATITRDEVVSGWTRTKRRALSHVERILARLPERERDFLEAMARLPEAERTLTRIAKDAGGHTAAQAGPTAMRLDTVRGLIDRGRPYAFRHRAVEALLTSSWPDVG